MKIYKKALLYDIANMAYLIADTGDPLHHPLHQVRDICEAGNIDRVSRMLGLAYADILTILSPVTTHPDIDFTKDFSGSPHNYVINFRCDHQFRYKITNEQKLKIKETCHEYMVCMVLADWLSVTLPEAADVWKFKLETARESLIAAVADITSSSACCFRRSLSPF